MKSNEFHTGVSRTTLGILVIFVLLCIAIAYVAVSSVKKTSRSQMLSIDDVNEKEEGEGATADHGRSVASNRHLETKLALLNVRQSNLENDVNRIEDKMTIEGNTDASGPGPALSQEEQTRQEEQMYVDQVDLLDRTLSEERRDPVWSQNADDAIHQKFMETGVIKSVKSVCQSTFCKVDMQFVNQAQAFQDLNVVGRSLPWNGQAFVKVDSNTGVGTIYLARQGFDLPRIEQ